MAFFKSKPRRYLLITFISFFIILLICIFLVIRFYIPSEIKKLVFEFSKENEIALSVKNITYNPFVGVRGEEIIIGDLPDKGITRLDVSNITVKPALISSFVKGKLVIEEIEVNNAHIELTDKISKFAERKDKAAASDKEDEESKVEVKKIQLNDITVSYSKKYRFQVNSLELSTGDKEKDITQIDMKCELGDNTALSGSIKINNVKHIGELNAEINNINNNVYANFISAPQMMSAGIEADFNFDEEINIEGGVIISAGPGAGKTEIASMDFNAGYDQKTDSIAISGLELESENISLFADGKVADLGTDPSVSANGKLNIEKLSETKKWFVPLQETELEGSLRFDDIQLKGFPLKDEYSLSARIISDSLSVKELELVNIEADSVLRINNDKTVVQIKEIKSELLGGSINGEINYTPVADSYDLKAEIKGKNINTGQIGHQLDLPVGGVADRFNILINASKDKIRSDITLEADNLSYGKDEDSLNITKAVISSPLEVEITSLRGEDREITVTGTNARIAGFSYLGIHSVSSSIPEIEIKYNKDIWEFDISAKGKELKHPSSEIRISDYDLLLHIENREFTSAKGKLGGTGVSFGDFSFSKPATSFYYDHERIKLTETGLRSEEYGKLSNAAAEIKFPEKNEDEYEIHITEGVVSGFDSEVAVKDLKGRLSYKNDVIPVIKGNLSSNIIHAFGLEFTNPDINFSYKQKKFNISGFKAGLYKGILSGSGYYNTQEPGSNFHLDAGLKRSTHVAGLDFIDIGDLSLSLTGHFAENKKTSGQGKLSFSDLRINKNGKVSNLHGSTDIKLHNDSILFENGSIASADDNKLHVKGEIHSLFSEERGSNFEISEMSLSSLAGMISPLLPGDISSGIFQGSFSVSLSTYNLFEKLSNWKGELQIKNAGFTGSLSKTDFQITGINGTVTLKDKTEFRNKLEELMGKDLVITKQIYSDYVDQFRDYEIKNNKDYLYIERLKYGFLTMNDIRTVFEIDKEKINLLHLRSKLYDGDIYGIGVLRFGGQEENYNLSLLVDDISLRQITDSLPSMQNYITGTVYGLLWFSVGDSYWTINGPFSLWAKDSKDEKRTIGRALLEKLGAKSRFFTRSSRRYDKGVISGYIKDGIMTFKKFEISNRILGYQDLLIRADTKMNSISVKHLLSVIRELARRASKGEIKIDYEKKKK